jgi:hypothetical protein
MKKILSFIMAALVSLPMFAAKVAAPVLKIDETGSLVVANRSGKTVYMYSVTNQGTPSQPETVLPEEGVKLLASGTYYIIVTAQTKKGKVLGRTNACYHVYNAPSSVTSFTLAAGGSDDKVFAPFTVTNAGDVDLVIARGTKGQFWKFDKKTAGGDVQKAISIGVDTRYPSRVSFYIKEKSGDGIKSKKVYVTYDGIAKGDTGYGVTVPAPSSMSLAGKFAPVWDLGMKGFAGKKVAFRLANGSEACSWSVLEQGFETF